VPSVGVSRAAPGLALVSSTLWRISPLSSIKFGLDRYSGWAQDPQFRNFVKINRYWQNLARGIDHASMKKGVGRGPRAPQNFFKTVGGWVFP